MKKVLAMVLAMLMIFSCAAAETGVAEYECVISFSMNREGLAAVVADGTSYMGSYEEQVMKTTMTNYFNAMCALIDATSLKVLVNDEALQMDLLLSDQVLTSALLHMTDDKALIYCDLTPGTALAANAEKEELADYRSQLAMLLEADQKTIIRKIMKNDFCGHMLAYARLWAGIVSGSTGENFEADMKGAQVAMMLEGVKKSMQASPLYGMSEAYASNLFTSNGLQSVISQMKRSDEMFHVTANSDGVTLEAIADKKENGNSALAGLVADTAVIGGSDGPTSIFLTSNDLLRPDDMAALTFTKDAIKYKTQSSDDAGMNYIVEDASEIVMTANENEFATKTTSTSTFKMLDYAYTFTTVQGSAYTLCADGTLKQTIEYTETSGEAENAQVVSMIGERSLEDDQIQSKIYVDGTEVMTVGIRQEMKKTEMMKINEDGSVIIADDNAQAFSEEFSKTGVTLLMQRLTKALPKEAMPLLLPLTSFVAALPSLMK